MFISGFLIGSFLCLALLTIFKKAFLSFCVNFNYSNFVFKCMEFFGLTLLLAIFLFGIFLIFLCLIHFLGFI